MLNWIKVGKDRTADAGHGAYDIRPASTRFRLYYTPAGGEEVLLSPGRTTLADCNETAECHDRAKQEELAQHATDDGLATVVDWDGGGPPTEPGIAEHTTQTTLGLRTAPHFVADAEDETEPPFPRGWDGADMGEIFPPVEAAVPVSGPLAFYVRPASTELAKSGEAAVELAVAVSHFPESLPGVLAGMRKGAARLLRKTLYRLGHVRLAAMRPA